MKYQDDKQIEKELEYDATDDTGSVIIGGSDFESNVQWKTYIGFHPNDENLTEVCFENFFPCAK